MTTLTFPALSRNTNAFEFGLTANTTLFTSPLSGAVQTIEMPSPRWRFNAAFDNLTEADAALLQGFFAQLRGQAGRFYQHNLARPVPRGIATGTPLVNGASQTGTSIITDGWTPSQTGILKVGDFFKIGYELKMVVSADVNSDGSGNATITFEPPIRTSPANDSAIITSSPTAVFKLTGDDNGWSVKPGLITSFNLQGIEVFQ